MTNEAIQIRIYTKSNDIPLLQEGSVLHSEQMFRSVEKIRGCTPYMLVAYNSNNKMIHSTLIDNTELTMGENELEFSIDTSSFADRLDGGYLGFYIWDNLGSLQPLAKAIELK